MGRLRAKHIPLIFALFALAVSCYVAAAIRYDLWPMRPSAPVGSHQPVVHSNGVYDTDRNLFGSPSERSSADYELAATASIWHDQTVLEGSAYLTAADEDKSKFKVQLTGQTPNQTAHVTLGSLHTTIKRLPLLKSAYPTAKQACTAIASFHHQLVQMALGDLTNWLREVITGQLNEQTLAVQVTAPASVWAAPPCAP